MFKLFPKTATALLTTLMLAPYPPMIYSWKYPNPTYNDGVNDGKNQVILSVEHDLQQDNHMLAIKTYVDSATSEDAEKLLNARKGMIKIFGKQYCCSIYGDNAICLPSKTQVLMERRANDILKKNRTSRNPPLQYE